MVKSIGLDIVEIDRIAADLRRFGRRFVIRILGKQELDVFDRRLDQAGFVAGRLAAKEAVIKALRHYLKAKPPYAEIQVVNAEGGAPDLILPPEIQAQLGKARCLLSISHEKRYAAAVAVFVEEP